jgi:hypothetical protein
MRFFKFIKNYYRALTPAEVIQQELAQAHLDRLEAESACEYAKACHDLSMSCIKRLNERMEEYK